MAKSVVKAENKILCLKCNKRKAPTNFYKNSKGDSMPYCKDCSFNMSLNEQGRLYKKRLQSTLKLLNKPFMNTLWEDVKILESPEIDKFRRYMYMLSRPNYSAMCWKDSIFDNSEEEDESDKKSAYIEKNLKWGFSDEVDLDFLENEYNDWAKNYSIDSKAMSEIVKQLCINQLQLRRANIEGKSTTQLKKDFQELMGTANLKPVQETGMQAGDTQTFGMFIKTIENERPIIEKDNSKPDWYDEMSIWWVGQMQKMIGFQDTIREDYEKELSKYTIAEIGGRGNNDGDNGKEDE